MGYICVCDVCSSIIKNKEPIFLNVQSDNPVLKDKKEYDPREPEYTFTLTSYHYVFEFKSTLCENCGLKLLHILQISKENSQINHKQFIEIVK